MRNTISKLLSIILLNVLLLLVTPTVSAIVTVPDPPQNLTATYITSGIYELDWDAPANDGGAPITGYQIEIASYLSEGYESEDWSSYLTIDAENTNYTDQQTLGYSYGYRVLAINSEGISLPSNYALVSASEADVPSSVYIVDLTVVSDSQIDISWEEPNDNGLPIIGYKIVYEVGGDEYTLVENTGPNDTNYSHTNLSLGTSYSYKIYAINALGAGPDYSWDSAKTFAGPGGVPGSPRNLDITHDYGSLHLWWNAPYHDSGSPVIGYQIEFKTEDDDWIIIVENTNSTNTNYVHTVPENCVWYTYRVSAINSFGVGSPSNEKEGRAKQYDDEDCDGIIDTEDPDFMIKKEPGWGWGIPGFELIFVLISIVAVLLWKKKNKK